jgi:hypothetical protein
MVKNMISKNILKISEEPSKMVLIKSADELEKPENLSAQRVT